VNGGMNEETKNKIMTARICTAVLLVSAFLTAIAPSALGAVPAFKLVATSQPTNLVRGLDATDAISPPGGNGEKAQARPQFNLLATNVGSAPTSGPTTVTDVLPAGITPVGAVARDRDHPDDLDSIACEIAGQTVTCTDPFSLAPGHWLQVYVLLKIDEDAPDAVTNEASVLSGGAGEATTVATSTVSDSLPTFDFLTGPAGLSAMAMGSEGVPTTQAGAHPYELIVDAGFPGAEVTDNNLGTLYAAGHLRNLRVTLPKGMAVNPTATPTLCTEAQLETISIGCPDDSQIGTVAVTSELNRVASIISPLYNMVPPPGAPASFGFNAIGIGVWVHLMGRVNASGEYELGSDTNEILARELNPVLGVQAQLWGKPSDPSHDSLRGNCVEFHGLCPLSERSNAAFLTMPGSCRETLSITAEAADWEEPAIHRRDAQLEDSLGNTTGTEGCNALDFDPSVEVKPTTNLADSPTGLQFNLHVPQTEDFEDTATANFKDVKVTLPDGLVVNPSSANGQAACSPTEIGLTTQVGEAPHFTEDPAACPDAAKLGSVEVNTPLLDHPLEGAVYLARPFDNPFGSLLALYIAVDDARTGVVAKLAGEVAADPRTGRLTTTFKDNPELPIEDVSLSLTKGPRAPLRTPAVCATYSTAVDVTPWSTPEGADAHLFDSFAPSAPAGGTGACPTTSTGQPNAPAFRAGTLAPQAGAYSPFLLKVAREDGSQPLAGIDTVLPKGLVGKLAGVPYCPESAIAQAQGRNKPNDGVLEARSPSCPAASQLGTVTVGAGAGISPFYAQGHAYLAGPYKGAPLSVVFITPAIAGPFDLGAVTVRAALRIDPETAQVRAVSDPLPQILEGIPLDLRSVEVKLDRPDFTLNPTSCDPMSVSGTATSAFGQGAALSSPFQVGGCSALGLKPKLAIRLVGQTKRTGHPALTATLSYPRGAYANLASIQVALPHSEFLDQGHIGTVCTRVQFAANQCPAASVYGSATATTPLLDGRLSGPVFLRSSSHELPDLVLDLHGQVDVVAAGRVDSVNGGIRTTFEALPDAPISKVVLKMRGGRKGLLINSTNLCAKTNRAKAAFAGQNGKTFKSKPVMAVSCKGKHRKGKGHGKAHR
jgi:hypothetical protein